MNQALTTRRPPLQFSLRTVMILTATVAIVLAFSLWDPMFGGPFSVLVAGAIWTALAVAAGRRRLAYYLAGASIGVIAMGVVCLPFLVIGGIPPRSGNEWGIFFLLALFSAATTTCVWKLRRRIRRPGWPSAVGSAAACVYLTAVLLVLWTLPLTFIGALIQEGPVNAVLGVLAGGFFGLLGCLLAATVYLPLAWPVAIGCVVLLRRIGPATSDPAEMERLVVDTVHSLRAERDAPIHDHDLEKRLPGNRVLLARSLYRLVAAGELGWTPERGYCKVAG